MKPIFVSVLFALVAACGGSDSKGDTSNSKNLDTQGDTDAAGISCEMEIALVCEEGFIDACLVTPAAASTHSCVAKEESGEEEEDVTDESEMTDDEAVDESDE